RIYRLAAAEKVSSHCRQSSKGGEMGLHRVDHLGIHVLVRPALTAAQPDPHQIPVANPAARVHAGGTAVKRPPTGLPRNGVTRIRSPIRATQPAMRLTLPYPDVRHRASVYKLALPGRAGNSSRVRISHPPPPLTRQCARPVVRPASTSRTWPMSRTDLPGSRRSAARGPGTWAKFATGLDKQGPAPHASRSDDRTKPISRPE